MLEYRRRKPRHIHVNAALTSMLVLQDRPARSCGQEQVTPLLELRVRAGAADSHPCGKAAQEFGAELRHLDIFGSGKLVTDGGRRQGCGAALVPRVLLNNDDGAFE